MVLSSKAPMREFIPKNVFHEGTNFFRQKSCEEVVLNRRTNDQIMPRLGRRFINNKYLFQKSEHCKS